MACALMALPLVASSANADEPTPDPTTSPVVIEAVDAASEALAEDVQAYNEAGFLDGSDASVSEPLETVDSAPAADEAMEAEEDKAAQIAEELSDGATPIHVDEVAVEIIGEPEVEALSSGDVTATVGVEITRHIAEDDIDWVEVVPHEMTIDSSTGEVLDVVVMDLEYQEKNSVVEGEPLPELMQSADDQIVSIEQTGLSTTNKQNAVNYALKYATSPNKSYKYYSTDCTNFVSQAMKAGGWKEVSHPWIDYKSSGAWWYGGIPTNSWSWSGAQNFYDMTRTLKRTTLLNKVYSSVKGDIIQYKINGNTNMTHTMLVTAKAASGMPYLTYHTPNTKNKPYSSITTSGKKWYVHRT